MAKRKTPPAAPADMTGDFEPDVFCIRTTDRDGRSYRGTFQWPREIGAIATCPDWDPSPVCGGGLHGNRDGVQDWTLLSDERDALWWIVGARSEECVGIDADKIKFPRAKIIYVGVMAEAMRIIARQWRRVAQEAVNGASTTGVEAHASTTGVEAHASTTGGWAHASTTGVEAHASTTGVEAHASTTGYRAHASTTGYRAHASTTGARAHASTTGARAHASTTGARAHASTTGVEAHASTTGVEAHASTTGVEAHASTTGYRAHASTTGARAHASTTGGRNAVAVSLGASGTAQAADGGWLVLTARDDAGDVVLVKAFQAGRDGVQPDTPYRLLPSGALVAVEGR